MTKVDEELDFRSYWRGIETVNDLSIVIANELAVPGALRQDFLEFQDAWNRWEEIMWADPDSVEVTEDD